MNKIVLTFRKINVMRKNSFFIAAIAGLIFASCANNEFTGQGPESVYEKANTPILFSGGASSLTRADLYGSAAAAKLSNKFVVYGTKHETAEDKTDDNDAVVFNNFQVEWQASTAGTTESNSSDWEYVGKASYENTTTSQAIKYWDYNTVGYTFYAFSSPDITFPKAEATDKIVVSKVTTDENSLYNKGYSVTVKDVSKLSNLYFSDRMPVAKTNYDKTVTLTFRSICSRVRFGFYETIPGYSVKIDKFYIDEDADPEAEPATAPITTFVAMKDAKTDGFYAALQNMKGSENQTLNITYYNGENGTPRNQVKTSNPTGGFGYVLKLGNGTGLINTVLGTSSTSPTWTDGATGAYTPVYAFEGNTNPLLLKLDFTMTAEDGSGDVIHVRGARAIVPTEYVKWKNNFAYTYIFKISDKSNGTTGTVDDNDEPTDPVGLKPITFDAIVVDMAENSQRTITSVSTNSITTFAEDASADEYKAGKTISVTLTNNSNNSIITPSAIGDAATQAQVYKLSQSASEAEVLAKLNGSPITGLTLTGVSGTEEASIDVNKVKFTPSAAGTYAYVYTTTAYVATQYLSVGSTPYDSGTTYYMKNASNVYYAVSVPTVAAFNDNKANLYIVDTAGTAGQYDIKVIKVAE